MCLSKLKNWRREQRLRNTVLTPKGVCIAIYCCKIFYNLIDDSNRIYQYDKDLEAMYKRTHPDNPYYGTEERQEIANEYLYMASNCHNREYVIERMTEELNSEYERKRFQ